MSILVIRSMEVLLIIILFILILIIMEIYTQD